MLRKLTVQNFAIIRTLEVSFSSGFTVITGETGAGKSILMGALALVTGARADTGVLLDREKKCVVEAEFSVSESAQGDFFSSEDLDFQNPCIIRREINPAGKSRSFINDIPVSLQQLKMLTSRLVDIHSQHQTLEIKESEKRFEYLDSYAANHDLLKNYTVHFKHFQSLENQLRQTEEAAARDAREMDYLKFQLAELDAFQPREGEYEQLKDEHEVLSYAEQSAGAFAEAVYIFDDAETSVRTMFARIRSLMPQIARLGQSGKNIQERFSSLETEVKDLTEEVRDLSDSISPDPQKLEKLSERLAGYEQLFRKHQCLNDADLCSFHLNLSGRCHDFSNRDEQLSKLKKELEQAQKNIQESGKKLSGSRKNAAEKFSAEVSSLLTSLEMKHARLQWAITPSANAHAHGLDDVDILFSANAGQELQPLSKTASGGELSRVMLAIKTLVAQVSALPAIIFDEIDTGVSGKVAAAMGSMMRGMGKNMQVMAITHLPQVAAHGHEHFEVYKYTEKGITGTGLRHLQGDARLQAIANMISHEKVSDAALRHAEDLLKAGNLA